MKRTQTAAYAIWIAPLALFVSLFFIAAFREFNSPSMLAGAAAFVVLGGLFFLRLRRADYSLAACCAVTALILAQPGLLLSISNPARGLWFAWGVYAIAASAASFIEREDARSVMQLGGSLAAIQILDPMGGLIVAALLPGLFGLNRKGFRMGQSAGLYALVLFVPVVTAITLAYLSRVQHLNIPQLIFGFQASHIQTPLTLPLRVLADCAPLLITVPLLLRNLAIGRAWTPPDVSIALIAGAIVIAAMTATLMGAVRDHQVLAAAAAPLPLVAISQWPKSSYRARDTIIVAAVVAVLAWSLSL